MNKDRFTIIAGDDFSFKFQYVPNGSTQPVELPSGYDILMGIYTAAGKPFYTARYDNGSGEIEKDSQDATLLRVHVSHAVSALMSGEMTMEITIFSNDHSNVKHADKIIKIHVEPRNNNDNMGTPSSPSSEPEEPQQEQTEE